jgi:hypothetical protein
MPDDDEGWAIERFGHWAVGWVEYLLVKPGTEAEAVAEKLLARLEDYPILDEMHFSQLEWDEATDYWVSLPLAERVELCERYDVSIFAARHDYIPDSTALYEHLSAD